MDLKIGLNISELRKKKGITQAQLAKYLCVSPQAISKWEQGASLPDMPLIPKIAFFFNVSIDTLFGSSNIEKVELLVSKYTAVKTDLNYRNAKEAIDALLDLNSKDLEALGLLTQLEFQRTYEALNKTIIACETLEKESRENHLSWNKRAKVQLIKLDAMIGNFASVNQYISKFESSKSVNDFNYLLVALRYQRDFDKIIRLGKKYIASFELKDQLSVYPNLLDAANELVDVDFSLECFNKIINDHDDPHQIFNAWFLMWELSKKVEELDELHYQTALVQQLKTLEMNEVAKESLNAYISGHSRKPVHAL